MSYFGVVAGLLVMPTCFPFSTSGSLKVNAKAPPATCVCRVDVMCGRATGSNPWLWSFVRWISGDLLAEGAVGATKVNEFASVAHLGDGCGAHSVISCLDAPYRARGLTNGANPEFSGVVHG